jgi:hypothetical protein
MALPWITRASRLVPLLLVAASCLAPQASAEPAKDRWGLTDEDWKTRNGPGLRARMGFPKNVAEVLAEAKKDDPKAMAILAGAYATGIGVQKNPQESDRLALRASQAGLPFGHFVAGLMFLDQERSGGPDPGTAEHYFLKAVDAGHAYAAYTLSVHYGNGKVLPRDADKAGKFLRQAADGGVAEAQTEAAIPMFLDDPFEALALLEHAEAQGEPRAGALMGLVRQQNAWNRKAEQLFLASVGNSLVGAWTTSGIVAAPCVSQLFVQSGQRVSSLWIVWQEITPQLLHATGFAINGTVMWNDRREARPRAVFNLGSRQAEDPDEHLRMHELINEARQLSQACQAFITR